MRYLIAAAAAPASAMTPVHAQEPTLDALLAAGKPIYEARCAECHSKTGRGLIGPSYIDNDRVANDGLVIRQVTRGAHCSRFPRCCFGARRAAASANAH